MHQLLRFAGKAWVSEKDVASEEERASYWDEAAPVWQVRICLDAVYCQRYQSAQSTILARVFCRSTHSSL